MRRLLIAAIFATGLALGLGVHVASQAPFLIFGSQSGLPIAIKATSNAMWVSLQSAPNLTFTATLFAALGTPANGIVLYCSDCTIANPCAGSGTGAIAKRLNGVWICN